MRRTDLEIKELLDRFMEGETSVEEEMELECHIKNSPDSYIPEGISPEDWETYKAMFSYFDETEEGHAKENAFPAHSTRRKRYLWYALSAAASVCLLFIIETRRNVQPYSEKTIAEIQTTTTKKDSIRQDNIATTSNEVSPVRHPSSRRKTKEISSEQPVSPHYIAENTTEETEEYIERAKKQADALLQAMHIQQQLDLQAIEEMSEENYQEYESVTVL